MIYKFNSRGVLDIIPTEIPDVKNLKPAVHKDNRGYLLESYRKDVLGRHGINNDFIQDNLSYSDHNALRGYTIN